MAQEELQQGPNTLVIHYRAARTDRTAFRAYLEKDFAAKLRAMKAKGELADFRIFYSWYRQPEVWDGMAVLRFPSHAAVLRWNALERTAPGGRSEEHTSELQSLMRISYAVFCLKKKKRHR